MKIRTDINIKIGDIEIRPRTDLADIKNKKFISVKNTTGPNYLYEIVKWKDGSGSEDRYCYVVALLDFSSYPDERCVDIFSCGGRPWELDEKDFYAYNTICREIFTNLKDLFVYDDSDNY